MDFASLPPEINSARMYAGAGPDPMLTAAAAWERLAAELETTAQSYEAVIAELATEWTGTSAGTMSAAAAPYLAWMHGTAATAEQTAVQLRAALAAYQSAFATTVPPPAIAANRSQLQTLVAGNVFGQNTPAIAATEAAYGAMWAQDVAAMYGYAAESVATTAVPHFAPAPQTTNPAGSTAQGAALGQAAAGSAAAESSSIMGALLGGLPAAGSDPALAAAYTGLAASLFGAFVIDSAGSFGVDSAGSFGIDFIGLDVAALLAPQLGSALPAAGLVGGGVAPVAAMVGQATPLSGLSVPPAWTAKAPPAIQYVSSSTALATSGAEAVPEAEPGMSLGEMATAGLAARAIAGFGLGRGGRGTSANRQRTASAPAARSITRIAPELRELSNLRDAGILTEEEFSEHKRLLLGH